MYFTNSRMPSAFGNPSRPAGQALDASIGSPSGVSVQPIDTPLKTTPTSVVIPMPGQSGESTMATGIPQQAPQQVQQQAMQPFVQQPVQMSTQQPTPQQQANYAVVAPVLGTTPQALQTAIATNNPQQISQMQSAIAMKIQQLQAEYQQAMDIGDSTTADYDSQQIDQLQQFYLQLTSMQTSYAGLYVLGALVVIGIVATVVYSNSQKDEPRVARQSNRASNRVSSRVSRRMSRIPESG